MLSEAPIISDSLPHEDVSLPEGAKLWYFDKYQLFAEIEDLAFKGECIFTFAGVTVF